MPPLPKSIDEYLKRHPEGTVIEKALLYSPPTLDLIERDPDQLMFLTAFLHTRWDEKQMFDILNGYSVEDIESLKRALRKLHNQVALRLMARDTGGLADFDEITATNTRMAELAITFSLNHLHPWLQTIHGVPYDEKNGINQDLVVIGMGELGGGELNISSDMDLIFTYLRDGETRGPATISNREYFIKLAQQLIDVLSDVTEDGPLFRVHTDMRPYGKGGPLVSGFRDLERYYHFQGREWERYAWIKGRVICGPGEKIVEMLYPFIFRKNLDFDSFRPLQELKEQIQWKKRHYKTDNNIYLGNGGIREVEFVVRVFQLVFGGRNGDLQTHSTLEALRRLKENDFLPEQAVNELQDAYIFLRKVERRLLYTRERQSPDLPQDTTGEKNMLGAMAYSTWEEFLGNLEENRSKVSRHFELVLGAPPKARRFYPLHLLWNEELKKEDAVHCLKELGYKEPVDTWMRLNKMKRGDVYKKLTPSNKKCIDRLAPPVIESAASFANPDVTLTRMLNLLESISSQEGYLTMFLERPHALQRVVKLSSTSSWLFGYLRRHPELLDGLMEKRKIYSAANTGQLSIVLSRELELCHSGGIEERMICLRRFKQLYIFDLVMQDLDGLLRLEHATTEVSNLADALLQCILRNIWQEMGKQGTPKFLIVAYGKLGSREMSYTSDVDIVFLYDDKEPDAIDTYPRLAQRVNKWLTAYTSAGTLYETDFRLRPDGEKGELALPITPFAEYQKNRAWVWEHQALTRARWVAGDEELGRTFEKIRMEVLTQPRDRKALQEEIIKMRDKMRSENSAPPEGFFNLKHHRGGIVDVEFIVQYLVLAYANQYPALMDNTGNIRLLQLAGRLDLIPTALSKHVGNAFRQLLLWLHFCRLDGEENGLVELEKAAPHAGAVEELWELIFR